MAAPSGPPTSGSYPIFLSPALLNQGLSNKDLITAIKCRTLDPLAPRDLRPPQTLHLRPAQIQLDHVDGNIYLLLPRPTRSGWELRPVDSVFEMAFDESPVKAAPKGRRKSVAAPKEEVKRQKTAPRRRRESLSESESDDGLTIEYPGGRAPTRTFGLGLGTPLGGREERTVEQESEEEREEEVDLEAELERELAKGGGESSESEEE
ncbi:hypothetical protein VE04_06847 [Pseudogymnoascus sp. 24MN13]|nr:hypothetical protein VE04_06847 [Pseudogymnoascus sp. 24MN13]